MKQELVLEVNRMKTIMGILVESETLTSITPSKNKENYLLEERMRHLTLLNESFGGVSRWITEFIEVVGKNSDEIIELGVKNVDEMMESVMKKEILSGLLNDLTTINKGIKVNPNTSKKAFITMLNNGKISKSVGEGWDEFVTKLKNNPDYTEVLKRKVKVPKGKEGVISMELGEFLTESKKDIVEAYQQIEELIMKAVNDPSKTNLDNGADFVKKLQDDLGGELDFLKGSDGEDIFLKNVEELFDKNLKVIDLEPSAPKDLEDIGDMLSKTDIEDYPKFIRWFKEIDWSKLLRHLKELFLQLLDTFIMGGFMKRQKWMNNTLIPKLSNSSEFTKNPLIKKGLYGAGTITNVPLSILNAVVNFSTAMIRILFDVVTQIIKATLPTIQTAAAKNAFLNKAVWFLKALSSEIVIWISQAVYLYLYDKDGKKSARIWMVYDMLVNGAPSFFYKMVSAPFRSENWVWAEEIVDVIIEFFDKEGYEEKKEYVMNMRENWAKYSGKDNGYKEKLKELRDCIESKRNMQQSDADFVETQADYEKTNVDIEDLFKNIKSKEDIMSLARGEMTVEKADKIMADLNNAIKDTWSIKIFTERLIPLNELEEMIKECNNLTPSKIEDVVDKEVENSAKKITAGDL